MKIQIRQAKEEEFDEIYKLVKTAFSTARVADGTEQDYVLELRKGAGYLPELELVATDGREEGKLIGHVMLTRFTVDVSAETKAAGRRSPASLLLAPLCVDIASRGKGVGGKLIRDAFRIAREKGYEAVFLVGDPDYYHRFGFRCSAESGVQNADGIEDRFVQVCVLSEGALDGVKGTITFH